MASIVRYIFKLIEVEFTTVLKPFGFYNQE